MGFKLRVDSLAFTAPLPGSYHWTCSLGITLQEGTVSAGQFMALDVAGSKVSYIIARVSRVADAEAAPEPVAKAQAPMTLRIDLKLAPDRYEALHANPPPAGTIASEAGPLSLALA